MNSNEKVAENLGAIFAVILLIAFGVYQFVLQYPNLKGNPAIGRWCRVIAERGNVNGGDRLNLIGTMFCPGSPSIKFSRPSHVFWGGLIFVLILKVLWKMGLEEDEKLMETVNGI